MYEFNKKSGYGIYFDKQKNISYQGNWKDGTFHGKGTFNNNNEIFVTFL